MAGDDHEGVAESVEEIVNRRIGGEQKREENHGRQHEEDGHVMRGVKEHVSGLVSGFVTLIHGGQNLPFGMDDP